PLVQVVDVLGDQVEVLAHPLPQPGERLVRRVGVHPRNAGPALVVEAVHQLAVGRERLRGGHVLGAVPLPQPVGVAEGRQAALGGDAGTGQYDDLHTAMMPGYRYSGFWKSNRAPASHSLRWLPCAGIPPASFSI